ncbi:ArsA family ATPase, partial [Jatrophihabitans sp. YIM 134969]
APRPRRRPAKKAADAAAGAKPAREPTDRGRALAAPALRIQSEAATLAAHDARMMRRFAAAHPDTPMAVVPALATDVHDLESLRRVGDLLVDGA